MEYSGVQTKGEQIVQVLEGIPVRLFRFFMNSDGNQIKRDERDKPWGEEGKEDFRV